MRYKSKVVFWNEWICVLRPICDIHSRVMVPSRCQVWTYFQKLCIATSVLYPEFKIHLSLLYSRLSIVIEKIFAINGQGGVWHRKTMLDLPYFWSNEFVSYDRYAIYILELWCPAGAKSETIFRNYVSRFCFCILNSKFIYRCYILG